MGNLNTVVEQFKIEGSVEEVKAFGNGLINDTYFVKASNPSNTNYLLQCINHNIFQDVDLLQNNIQVVTDHIRKKLTERGESDIERKTIRLVDTKDGKKFYFDGAKYWRLMVHIPGSTSYEVVDPKYSQIAGAAFGDFQSMLADLPVQLKESIPNFHNMEFRLKQLNDAIAENKANRLSEVSELLAEISKRADTMCLAEKLYRAGELPKRVCHCDTKVNNILFDKETGAVLCVIDLDTVMSSFIFSDYGDFIRTAANTGAEDDKDLNNVNLNVPIFESFTKGYLESAKGFLTPIEINNLPYAAKLFPYMQAVRFLTDYINGDTYYKIAYPEHNLVRTNAQMKLLTSIEAYEPKMVEFIKNCI